MLVWLLLGLLLVAWPLPRLALATWRRIILGLAVYLALFFLGGVISNGGGTLDALFSRLHAWRAATNPLLFVLREWGDQFRPTLGHFAHLEQMGFPLWTLGVLAVAGSFAMAWPLPYQLFRQDPLLWVLMFLSIAAIGVLVQILPHVM